MARTPVWIAVVVVATAVGWPQSATARAGGIVTDDCTGCHGGGAGGPPDLTLTADRATFNPGDSVTFALTIRWSSIRVGGTFITTSGVGTLEVLPGEGLAVNAQGLTHTAPKPAVNGAVTFHFAWQAPSTPGAVDFGVAAMAGNGNNAPTGDSPGRAEFQWVFGCTARTFYLDLDRDGYGSKNLGTRLGCTDGPAPDGYAAMDGDCDENDEKVHSGAIEICNMKDDNCNGQIDENAPPVMMWPDHDGDGYYKSQTGTPKVGCGNVSGYAARSGDCDDTDATIHPGGTEICNNRDDNCDGEIDERVRPQCGVGWCARYSPTCNPADCRPGPQAVEVCNSFDDDCDGEDDNGACPAGMVCSGHQCVPTGGATSTGAPTGSRADGGSGVDGSSEPDAGSISAVGGTRGGAADEQPASGCTASASASERRRNGTRASHAWAAIALAAWLGRARLRGTKRR